MTGFSNSNLGKDLLFNVDGLVALVTGGGSGIGFMMTKGLIQNGAAKVYIAGRRLDVLNQAAIALGPNVIPVKCDVTSKSDLQQAVDFIKQDAGFLNLLVCNSGILGPQVKAVTPTTTLQSWADANFAHDFKAYVDTFAVNVAAVWYTSIAFLDLLSKGNDKGNLEQSSQIIITSSVASFNKKAPSGWAYGQSKAAATLATKQLGVALPQWNIRANGIAPGLFPSDMSVDTVSAYKNGVDNSHDIPPTQVPLRRMGREEEIAGTLLYLTSRAGAYTNGATLLVDGGRLGNFPSTN